MRHPLTLAAVVVAGLVYGAAVVANASNPPHQNPPQPRDEFAFGAWTYQALNGHPGHPLSQYVPRHVLLEDGDRACEWLEDQPEPTGPDQSAYDRALAYQRAVPPPSGWPFRNRPGGLRTMIVIGAWTELCDDVRQRQTREPRPGDD
jgi:hypothetical protein